MNSLNDDIHVWYQSVPSESPETTCLSEYEIERASKFVRPVDRRRYLATRRMVREVLSKYHAVAPTDWTFVTNSYGKPRMSPDLQSDVYFNVSHTKSVIVCALAKTPDIGVDIEDRIPDDFRLIAKSYFAPTESDWLASAANDVEAHSRFLAIWTMKEAYIKAVGKGLSLPLGSFSVVDPASGIAKVTKSDSADRSFRLRQLSLFNLPVALAYPSETDVADCKLLEHDTCG